MTTASTPHDTQLKAAVLLATYNGETWLRDQITSIFENSGVDVHIFVSDDGSRDSTLKILQEFDASTITLLPSLPQGSAGQNFLRLLRDAPFEDGFDFVALSDQDDVWLPTKLGRAIDQITTKNLSGYSSDVTAFWPDGTRKYIRKSQPKQPLDFLFEGGGPGNTYVMPTASALRLRGFLAGCDAALLKNITMHHDWLIYAYFRQHEDNWMIDDHSHMDYRQHDNNVLGSSIGLSSLLARVKLVSNQWYFKQVETIGVLVEHTGPAMAFIQHPDLKGLTWMLTRLSQFRRRRIETVLLGGAFVWYYIYLSRKRPQPATAEQS